MTTLRVMEAGNKKDFKNPIMNFSNTVNTPYSELSNLHCMVNLDENWSKIFTIWLNSPYSEEIP